MTPNHATIAKLNDLFRKSPFDGELLHGQLYVTAGVNALPNELRQEALDGLMAFDTFTPDNDPWGEHDYGSFTLSNGQKVAFQFSYYADSTCKEAGDGSANCYRALVLMFPEER